MEKRVQLDSGRLRKLAQSIGELATIHSFDELQQNVFASLDKFAPGSLISNDKLDLEHRTYGRVSNHHISLVEQLTPYFGELLLQGYHPYVEYIRQGGQEIAVRTTDIVSMNNFQRNPIYNEVYRVAGLAYGMFSIMRIDGPVPFLSFAILRDRNFTDSEQILARVYLEQVGRTVKRLANQSIQLEQVFIKNCKASRLTAREIEVMLLLFKGKTDKEIAGSTGTSPRTVSNQVSAVFRKIAVQTRSEAVRKLLGSWQP